MSKQTNVSRDDVYRVADTMTAEGLKPSVRNVQAQLGGGSHSTITRHLRTWRGRQEGDRALEVPGSLLDAISAYAGESVARKTRELSDRLEAAEVDLEHLSAVVAAAEKEIESLQSKLQAANQKRNRAEDLVADLKSGNQRFQEQLETKSSDVQTALRDLAEASAQAEAGRAMAERESLRADQLGERLHKQQTLIDQLRKEKVELEGRLATALSERQDLESQVAELTRSLERSARAESDLNATLHRSVQDLREQLEGERQERMALAEKLVELTASQAGKDKR